MRVLLSVHHELDADSGAPGATMALGSELAGLGNSVSYLSFDDLPGRPPFMAASLAYPYFAAAKLAAAAKDFDVIDASTGDAWVWGRLDRRRKRPLLATRSHGLEHLFQEREVERAAREGRKLSWRYPLYWGGWRLREVAASLRASDLVFVLSEEEREVVVGRLGVDPERVRLTANGVPDRFLESVAAAGPNPGGPGIAMIGAHRAAKGIEHACVALADALAADPGLRASFLGSGVPKEETMERFPTELRPRVAITESYRREQLPELLRGHSLAIFPSFSEGFSLALVETMVCGVAPVASDIPGHRAIVADGENGILTPPGDAAAASAAILRLRGDEGLTARLREAAAATGRGYSWRRIATDTAAAYAEAIAARDGAAA